MICLQQNIHAVIRMGENNGYVAECMEIAVVTQGKALDETSQNLAEAVSLHLQDEDPSDIGFHILLWRLFLNCSQNMPRLKRLSGEEVIKIFEGFGFRVHSQ